jgi:hypothetical protein
VASHQRGAELELSGDVPWVTAAMGWLAVTRATSCSMRRRSRRWRASPNRKMAAQDRRSASKGGSVSGDSRRGCVDDSPVTAPGHKATEGSEEPSSPPNQGRSRCTTAYRPRFLWQWLEQGRGVEVCERGKPTGRRRVKAGDGFKAGGERGGWPSIEARR